jgi:hypothetical protein
MSGSSVRLAGPAVPNVPRAHAVGSRRESDAAALIDRIHRLRLILPAMAQETADARREAARLRLENAKLRQRVAELERDSGERS